MSPAVVTGVESRDLDFSGLLNKKVSLPYPSKALKNQLFATTRRDTMQSSAIAAFTVGKASLRLLLQLFYFDIVKNQSLNGMPNWFW